MPGLINLKLILPATWTFTAILIAEQESYNDFMGAMTNRIQRCGCDIIGIAEIETIADIEPRHGCISILVSVTPSKPQQVHILQF
jgi:hypothetical protein